MSLVRQFPEKKGIDYSKIQITPEGEYSMTKKADGQRILQKIEDIVNSKDLHITDLTGNVGADTILFGLNFKKVDSIEYNKENFDALQNNVSTFKLKNVNVHFGDSTKIYDWPTDILYLDPPWGGPEYKTKENLDLFLGKTRIDMFIKKILKKSWRPSFVFMKLPRNYNFERLHDLENVKQEHNFSIRNFNLFCLEVDLLDNSPF